MDKKELEALVRNRIPVAGVLVAGRKQYRRLKGSIRKDLQAEQAQYQTVRGKGYLVGTTDGIIALEFTDLEGLVTIQLVTLPDTTAITAETYKERKPRNPGAMASRNAGRKALSKKRKKADPNADLEDLELGIAIIEQLVPLIEEKRVAETELDHVKSFQYQGPEKVEFGDDYWLTYSVPFLRGLKKTPLELATSLIPRAENFSPSIVTINLLPYPQICIGPIPATAIQK